MSTFRLAPLSLTFLAASLAACGSMPGSGSMPMAASPMSVPFSQEALPDADGLPGDAVTGRHLDGLGQNLLAKGHRHR